MRRVLLLACLLGLAMASGASLRADDAEDVDDGTAEDGQDEPDVSSSVNKTDSSSMCPTGKKDAVCSGNGVCEPTEDSGVACKCNAGYHGDDCSELDDEFDVYFNRLMAQSAGQTASGREKLMDSKLGSWDTRIKAIQKRFDREKEDVERFVNKMVAIETKRLDEKAKQVEKHEQDVNKLQAEVNELPDKMLKEIDEKVEQIRADIAAKVENNAKTAEQVEAERAKLNETVYQANKLGEHSRFNRMVSQWQLCDINPGHKDCQKKDKGDHKPGVHIVVETKNVAKYYPQALAKDETAQAKAGPTGGVKVPAKPAKATHHMFKAKQN